MPFTFDGESVDDTLLYFWSLKAISRTLRFQAEAEVFDSKDAGYVLTAIASYYALFHLGVFISCAVPQFLSSKLRKKIQSFLDADSDPSRAASHEDVRRHLATCEQHGLPTNIRGTFEKAQALRNFVNYGPNLTYTPQKTFRVFNRDYDPSEQQRIVCDSKRVIADGVEWSARQADLKGDLVAIAIQNAAAFFNTNSDGLAYYAPWSSPEVLENAESHRAQLQECVMRIVEAAHRNTAE